MAKFKFGDGLVDIYGCFCHVLCLRVSVPLGSHSHVSLVHFVLGLLKNMILGSEYLENIRLMKRGELGVQNRIGELTTSQLGS